MLTPSHRPLPLPRNSISSISYVSPRSPSVYPARLRRLDPPCPRNIRNNNNSNNNISTIITNNRNRNNKRNSHHNINTTNSSSNNDNNKYQGQYPSLQAPLRLKSQCHPQHQIQTPANHSSHHLLHHHNSSR